MKKIAYVGLALFFVCLIYSPVLAGKKAGEIKDGVFTDTSNNFSIAVPEGWGTKISSAKKALRLILSEKSYPLPRQFQGGGKEDYAQIPMIHVLVDTTSLTVAQFVDSLLEPKFKSKQKKYFLKYLKLISKAPDVLRKKEMTLGNARAIQIEVRQQYSMEISADRNTDRADVVNDYRSGSMFVTVRQGKVIIVHMINEWQFHRNYLALFGNIIGSLKFSE